MNTELAVVSGPTQISVVADLDAQTYSVSVNGGVVGTDILFDAPVSSLSQVRYFTDNLNEENFSGRTIDNVTVSSGSVVGNTAPVANAGLDQAVSVGATVILDGSGSSDADADPLTYQWSLTTVPAGSGATLTGPTTVSPSFEADVRGAT